MSKSHSSRRHLWLLPLLALSFIASLSFSAGADEALATLPALAAKATDVTVSGISSGAYMAGQVQIAHSDMVSGAALIAGGPYGCAESAFADMMPGPGAAFLNMSKAMNGCMLNGFALWGIPNVDQLVERTRTLAEKGKIASLDTLKTDRVYLFSGTADHTVVPAIVEAAEKYYERIGIPKANITYVHDMPAGHAFITLSMGGACGLTRAPYVSDCDYDQAGAILKALLPEVKPAAISADGRLVEFDQRPFTKDMSRHGLADRGFAYIPKVCEATSCRIHIAFHGCDQNASAVDDKFVKSTGFEPWATSNDLIILFPQTETSLTTNPQGCWDWWGYTSRDYLTRTAPQIQAVHRMVAALAAPR